MSEVRSYHGTGEQAIEWALHHSNECGLELDAFLRCWQQGDLDEWPDFYEWLDAQRVADQAAHIERIEALNAELVAALTHARNQFQFYADEHQVKSDAAYKAWDDARYWGNVAEQEAAHKKYHKRLTQTGTNRAMVKAIDAALASATPTTEGATS
jgi:hypothetical protein